MVCGRNLLAQRICSNFRFEKSMNGCRVDCRLAQEQFLNTTLTQLKVYFMKCAHSDYNTDSSTLFLITILTVICNCVITALPL